MSRHIITVVNRVFYTDRATP